MNPSKPNHVYILVRGESQSDTPNTILGAYASVDDARDRAREERFHDPSQYVEVLRAEIGADRHPSCVFRAEPAARRAGRSDAGLYDLTLVVTHDERAL